MEQKRSDEQGSPLVTLIGNRLTELLHKAQRRDRIPPLIVVGLDELSRKLVSSPLSPPGHTLRANMHLGEHMAMTTTPLPFPSARFPYPGLVPST